MPIAKPVVHEQECELESFGDPSELVPLARGSAPLRPVYVFPADSFDEIEYRFSPPGRVS